MRWFKHVYLFGSILDEEAQHNDIDILVVYKTYSKEVENAIHSIKNVLERESGIMIDLTALSIEEETETAFLKRIEPRYLQLK